MAKKRVPRKKLLKEPDEFITTTGRLITWARENTKPLIFGASAFFGLVLIIAIFSIVESHQAARAEAALSQAMVKYESALGDNQPVEALDAVREDFDALLRDYGGQPAGRLGRILFGHYCLAAGALDDAIRQYETALKDFEGDPALAPLIWNGLGTAYQQKGDYAQAMVQYEKIVSGTQTVLKDAALFNLGHLHEQMGEADEGRKLFEQLGEDFPQSIYANLVREKLGG